MNTTTAIRTQLGRLSIMPSPQLNFDIPDGLLAEVDFKWLMAGLGWHVDLARLHCDAAYAAQILGKAMGSEMQALRDCAAVLSARLDHGGGIDTGERPDADWSP